MKISSDEAGDTPPQTVSFSVSLRTSRRRRSRLARPQTPPSACEESAHYPVFNPQDPRHNPAIRTTAFLEDADNPPQMTHSTGSIRWVQSLPGRSLRRARSGLQALRTGLHRRPDSRSADGSTVTNGVWSSSDSAGGSSDPHERLFSSTVSEATTEEDYDFGTDLYRTGCKYPDLEDELSKAMSSLAYIPRPHPAPPPVSSTGDDLALVSAAEMTSNARSGDGLPTTAMNLDNFFSSAEGHRPTSIGQCMEQSILADVPPPPDEDPASPTRNSHSQHSDSSVSIAPEIVIILGEAGAHLSSADIQDPLEPEVATEETEMSCALKRISSGALHPVEDIRSSYDGAQVAQQTEETRTTCTSIPEDPGIESVGEDIEPTHILEAVTANRDNIVPEVEFDDLINVEHYLSLNTLGGSNALQSKPSGEEPSPTSPSDDDANAPLSLCLPTETGDRTSLLSLRDEYFLVDGKSTDLRPDRDDNPIKGERVFTGDGGMHSGPGLDRNLSIRTQEIPEIIGPGGPLGIPSPRQLRRDREGSDSTEEYLVTYSLLHRHYFS